MITLKNAALITGGAKRIGKAISKKLASENKNLIIHYNKSKKEALALCKELNKNKNISCISVQANLKNKKDIINIFSFLKKNQ